MSQSLVQADLARELGSISLRQVTKHYGKECVVDAIDIDIAAGEFFSLLGPSGSGKTTTLMMLAGFVSVDTGQICIDERDIAQVAPQHRGFGMVFQNYAIFPHLNVFDNVAFPLRARKIPKPELTQRVMQALELVRLEGFTDRFARQLSGGQQQRVAIARAIVFNPSIVLMDEPLGALDKNLRYQMQVEIKDIQKRLGMTVVYVTHDQEEAMNMSDRIAIMNHGRIEQIGRPADIYKKPNSTFIAKFLGEANLVRGKITQIQAGVASVRTAEGLSLRAQCDQTFAIDTLVDIFMRPERVVLSPSASLSDAHQEDWNRCQGTVANLSFLGNILRQTVLIEPGITIVVDTQNSSQAFAVEQGDVVTVSWRIDDSVLLRVNE